MAGTEGTSRVADVLLMFAQGPVANGVSEIARELHLSKAVVHRILQSLASRGFVQIDQETRTYRLGPAAVALGARALGDLDMRRAARPVLRRLRDLTRETTTLSALVQQSRIYLDQYESPQEIKMTVELGRPHPLYAGASSRAILAYLPADFQQEVTSSRLEPLTTETVVHAEQLRRLLITVHEQGCATSCGERQEGAGSVAAPIFGLNGEVVGATSVCGPEARFTRETVERFRPMVRTAAQEISQALGGRSGRQP